MSGYTLNIFGVQPLKFTDPERNIALSSSALPPRDASPEHMPGWARELEHLYPDGQYHHQRLAQNLDVTFDEQHYRFSAWLFSSNVLNQHLVVFEAHALDTIEPEDINERSVRAMLTATVDDRRPHVITDAIDQACRSVAELARTTPDAIEVTHDSCNITLFLRTDTAAATTGESLQAALAHGSAERLSIERKLVEVSGHTRLFFGGRAHMVVSTSDNDVHVLRQIMFTLQVMWFYVPVYLRHATTLHRQILSDPAKRDLDALETTARRLVYVYQAVRLHNESAKISYEALSPRVYHSVEGLWSIENSIDQLERYGSFFREFIRDTREIQSRKADETLNYVLAVLALFGLVGVWADILGAELAAHNLTSIDRLFSIATGSWLGFGTIAFITAAGLVALWLIAYNIRTRHGRKGLSD
ncbi:MAG TPA: hypothetical protein VFJ15_09130 [Oleiagrimonas sp.]|nr:hypothetical protein [Oleiagrimonas sp.]